MANALMVHDETPNGERYNSFALDFPAERITVRELIRRRVYEEVRERAARPNDPFRGLVQPAEAERLLNGEKRRQPVKADWEEQAERALAAFQRNGFFILVDDRQPTSLDDEIDLRLATEVSFVKLVPLVGG